jgi:hypothetical protein
LTDPGHPAERGGGRRPGWAGPGRRASRAATSVGAATGASARLLRRSNAPGISPDEVAPYSEVEITVVVVPNAQKIVCTAVAGKVDFLAQTLESYAASAAEGQDRGPRFR